MNAPQVMSLNHWTNLAGSLKILVFQNNVALVGELPHEFSNLVNLESLVTEREQYERKFASGNREFNQIKKACAQPQPILWHDTSSLMAFAGTVNYGFEFQCIAGPNSNIFREYEFSGKNGFE